MGRLWSTWVEASIWFATRFHELFLDQVGLLTVETHQGLDRKRLASSSLFPSRVVAVVKATRFVVYDSVVIVVESIDMVLHAFVTLIFHLLRFSELDPFLFAKLYFLGVRRLISVVSFYTWSGRLQDWVEISHPQAVAQRILLFQPASEHHGLMHR